MTFDALTVIRAADQFPALKTESDALETLLTKFTESHEKKYLTGFSKLAGAFIEKTLRAFNLEWPALREHLELEAAFVVGFQTPHTTQTGPLPWDKLLEILAKLGAEVGPSLKEKLALVRSHLAKDDDVSRAVVLFALAWPVALEHAARERADAKRRNLTIEEWAKLPFNERVRGIRMRDGQA